MAFFGKESEYAHWKRIHKEHDMAKKKCEAVTDCKVTALIDLRAEYDKNKDKEKEKFLQRVKVEVCELLPEVESHLVKHGCFLKTAIKSSHFDKAVQYRLKVMYSEAGYIATIEDSKRIERYDILSMRPPVHEVEVSELTISLKK